MPDNAKNDAMLADMLRRDRLEGERRSINREVGLTCVRAGMPVILVSESKIPIHKRWKELSSSINRDEWEVAHEEHSERFGNDLKFPFHMGAIGDEVTLRRVWNRNRDCLIGLPMGVNKLVVLDPDNRDAGHGPTLLRAFFERNGGIPEGVIVSPTQGGGEHWYFSDHENLFSNSEGSLSELQTNVRGAGGQALAPGGMMPDGKRYGTIQNLEKLIDAIRAGTLPQIPKFVVDLIQRGKPANAESEVVQEEETAVFVRELRANEIIGENEIFDPGLGGFDLEAITADRPKFAALMARAEPANGDFSTARLSFASNLRGAYPKATPIEILSAMVAVPNVCGTFIGDHKPSKGEFNYRNAARDFLRASSQGQAMPADEDAIGDAFGDVTGGATDAPAVRLAVDIGHTETALSNIASDSNTPGDSTDAPANQYDPDASDEAASEQKIKRGWIGGGTLTRNRKPLQYLVKGLIPSHGVGLVYGKPNVGKSFLMIELANRVQRGQPFLGRKTKQKTALYLFGEGAGGISGRMRAWENAYDVSGGEVAFGLHPPDLTAADAAKKIIAIALNIEKETGDPVGLVLIDTLSACAAGASDSDEAEMKPVMRTLRQISDKLGCAVVVSHHPGKDMSRGMRGSTVITGAADFVLPITDERGVKTVVIEKMRDGGTDGTASFRLREVQIGQYEDGDPETSCVVEHVACQLADVGAELVADDAPHIVMPDRIEDRCEAVMETMRTLSDEGLADDERRGGAPMPLGLREITSGLARWRVGVGLPDLKRQRVGEILKRLADAGLVTVIGAKSNARYRLS